jgi:hypothetical protein
MTTGAAAERLLDELRARDQAARAALAAEAGGDVEVLRAQEAALEALYELRGALRMREAMGGG